MKFELYRTTSKLQVDTWVNEEKKIHLLMLEMSPAFPDNPKGPPKEGEKRYDFSQKCVISFDAQEALKASFSLQQLAIGNDVQYKKMADTSKVKGNTEGEIKSIVFAKGKNGGTMIGMASGERKIHVIINPDETYALAKYLETYATRWF